MPALTLEKLQRARQLLKAAREDHSEFAYFVPPAEYEANREACDKAGIEPFRELGRPPVPHSKNTLGV